MTTMTDPIYLKATDRSPSVEFDFATDRLSITGESYPEDAAAFFGPLLEAMDRYLTQATGRSIVLDMRMSYFNSSSAKAFMNLFQMLEEAARRGVGVTINWRYHPEDDTMEEFGEDFSEDFDHAAFNLLPDEEVED